MSYTDEVHFDQNGIVFALRQQGEVRVDDVIVELPYTDFFTGVTVKNAGSNYVVSIIFAFSILQKYNDNYKYDFEPHIFEDNIALF